MLSSCAQLGGFYEFAPRSANCPVSSPHDGEGQTCPEDQEGNHERLLAVGRIPSAEVRKDIQDDPRNENQCHGDLADLAHGAKFTPASRRTKGSARDQATRAPPGDANLAGALILDLQD